MNIIKVSFIRTRILLNRKNSELFFCDTSVKLAGTLFNDESITLITYEKLC